MGAGDGSIGSATKVVDHGSPLARWDLVVLGDGYQASELGKFHSDVQAFIDRIRTTPPFDELWCGINVWRVDVTSTDSGADDPTGCGGTGATPRTFFDATFCSPWGSTTLERLLTVDSTRADAAAKAAVPLRNQTLVIVNSAKYGGAGGSVASCSTHASSAEIAIHEIGHSAFGLADEYENGGNASGPEPPEPNVTFDANRTTNKWRDLIAASTPMPSSCNSGCTGCTPPASPPPAGAVGAYEGAVYVRCGAYRPLPSCYMRDYGPFCPVCSRVIRQALQQHLPPESIALQTPGVAFGNVPEGVGGVGQTTFRAVVFEVQTCRRLTFRVVSGPTGAFTAVPPAQAQVLAGPYTPANYARLWISYTSTTAGDTASGSVTVRLDQTGQTWTIPISAATVARPRTEVVLVLDRSGSMKEEAGDGTTKVQKLREAAGVFIQSMLPGDGLSVVRFDSTAQRLTDVTDVGPAPSGSGRSAALNQINSPALDPGANTSIGAGVQAGRTALVDGQAAASTPYGTQAMVILTDGMENTAPTIATASAGLSANTFAIGLGLPHNISVAALQALTQGNKGYLLVTGALDESQRHRLAKYFLQVLAGVNNAGIVLDPHGELPLGREHRIPFTVSEADIGLDAFLLTSYPYAVDFRLETPDGTVFEADTAAELGTGDYVVGDDVAYHRLALPAVPDPAVSAHQGVWTAVLKRLRESETQTALPYDLLVHCHSNLSFQADALQGDLRPGADVALIARLREYDVPVEDRATVWAEVTWPSGGSHTVLLKPKPGGDYAGSFRTTAPGLYTIRVRAHGETLHGSPFTREQLLTAQAVVGGAGTPGQEPGDDRLVELLCCLVSSGAIGPAFFEQWGMDPNLARRCLARLCRERPDQPGDG
ncbi:M64 family metallopeptidase [Streptomyces sp. NBC_00572]|uniref:M64 family metallopeptidase n=1 Tax=Streptomyces sp. NBC_00572 TaxID=2903664 RepID=UPI002258CED5|nr:M64 family metallopeptidase [Streptomyces sp. NBC_00572]MCX4985820.1 M64 family metallo-endopeptidase [Streptomyces sp. NBC_00572]